MFWGGKWEFIALKWLVTYVLILLAVYKFLLAPEYVAENFIVSYLHFGLLQGRCSFTKAQPLA